MADIRDLVFAPARRRKRHPWLAPAPRSFRPRRRRSAMESPWMLAVLAGAALGLWGEPLLETGGDALPPVVGTSAQATVDSATFGLCHTGGGWNCVVDGDTFYLGGVKVRIADIDTPETHPPRCAAEARLGEAATLRLQALLGAGPFALEPIDRDEDRHGRKLRVVTRNGESLGDKLVSEGLARPYGSGRRSWCAA